MRDHNEDYLGHVAPATPSRARSHGWLFALADGVGGQERGEVASREAVEDILAGFQPRRAGEPPAALLTRLVQSANVHVYEAGQEQPARRRRMATTLVACALRLRPRDGGARRRFALLSDPQGPCRSPDPRPHRGARAGAARALFPPRRRPNPRHGTCSPGRSEPACSSTSISPNMPSKPVTCWPCAATACTTR